MTLDEWLAFIERQHSRPIDLGLDRVRIVSERLGQSQSCPLIVVGGTNGKGSTCAMLEQILLVAGYRVALYTSPHMCAYNERVRIGGRPAGDAAICQGFQRVEAARGDIPLTYFEFGTLAAWETMAAEQLDVVILEVGLGGRLDATNIYEPDVTIVTGIDLDHMDYLGPTREEIGFEKAGIFRCGRPAIYGDRNPPQRLLESAAAVGADLLLIGRDFRPQRQEGQWQYQGRRGNRNALAFPALRGTYQLDNASCALAALAELGDRLPVAMQDIRQGLALVTLPGRCQVLPGRPEVVLDVAHNPQAARALADNLGTMQLRRTTWAIFGMLHDKDIEGVVAAIKHRVDRWLLVGLPGRRGTRGDELSKVLEQQRVTGLSEILATPTEALRYARANAHEDDRIVAFGSFLIVADLLCAHKPDAAKRT